MDTTTPRPDIQIAYEAIERKSPAFTQLYGYYDGDQPRIYSDKHIRKVFGRDAQRFQQNWCAVVVDSALDRLNLTGYSAEDEAAEKAMQAVWDANELGLMSDDVHEGALVCGECYAVVWPHEQTGDVEVYYNDPRLCHIQYDAERPRVKRWAAKRWLDDDGYYRMMLYYPERLEYYRSDKVAEYLHGFDGWKSLRPLEPATAPNATGEIPVFHWRLHRRKTKSELVNVTALQDGINRLLTNMMVSAEYGAFAQRWIMSNAEIDNLKNSPNEIWHLPEGASVGQFDATTLENFFGAMDNLASSIGVISRTPKHYFYQDTGGNISGEALIALEAPLNKKCESYIESFTSSWRRMMVYALKLSGMTVDPAAINPVYAEPATVQPRTEAEILQLETGAGLPVLSSLRRHGADQAELDQVAQEMAEAKAAEPTVQPLGLSAGLEGIPVAGAEEAAV